MKRRTIVVSESARQNLRQLTIWLSQRASNKIAHRYVARIQERITQLEYGAERGTVRNTRSGLRLIGILPNVNLAFTVSNDTVYVLRVIYGGQDWQAALTDSGED
jgi:plasmid stabilization system protein ParE